MEGEPMKSRSFWVSIITVAISLSVFGSVLLGAEDANQGNQLKTLQAKIDTLEKTTRTQQEQITRTEKALSDVKKQLDEQVKENKRLRLLCEKAGVDTTGEVPESIGPNQPSVSPDRPIVYQGHERTKEWFERMYLRFSGKISLLNGKLVNLVFVDVGKLKYEDMTETPLQVGTIIQIPSKCKVLSVIGNDSVLLIKGIERKKTKVRFEDPHAPPGGYKVYYVDSGGGVSNFYFHVTGYDGPSLSDDQIFPYTGKLVCVGTYKYAGGLGTQNTIQSFKIWQPEPLTREQFAEAISSGFELVEYVEREGKTIEKPIH
jgi:hypothetical protein